MIYYFEESPFYHTERGCWRLQRTKSPILEAEAPTKKHQQLCSLCRRRKVHPLAIAKAFTALEKYRRKGVVTNAGPGRYLIEVAGQPTLVIESDGSFCIK